METNCEISLKNNETNRAGMLAGGKAEKKIQRAGGGMDTLCKYRCTVPVCRLEHALSLSVSVRCG